MKRIIINGLIALASLAPQMARALGAIYLSNVGQTSTANGAVAIDSWLATSFYTGSNPGGYVINSVQVAMADALGSPSAFTVMVYANNNNPGALYPGYSLGTLSGSADPATGGVYTFDAQGNITLLPKTGYFIVLTSGTAAAAGACEWSLASTYSYNPTAGWSSGGDVRTSSDGLSWLPNPGNPEYAIYATAAPEPGVIGLFALGGLLVGFRRWKATAG